MYIIYMRIYVTWNILSLKQSYRNLYLSVISTVKWKKNYIRVFKKKKNFILQEWNIKIHLCKITWHIRSIPRYYWNLCRCYWPLKYSAVIRKQVIIWNGHGSIQEPILKVFLLNEWERLKREIGQNCVLFDGNYTFCNKYYMTFYNIFYFRIL